MIGSTLTEEGRNKLCGLLQRNLDIFSWKPADMTGVPRYIVEHRLNIREGCSPVRQKKRGQAADRNQAIQEEVGKLVERMCVDFKDLNKACLKDGYPLSEIDWKVESLCGFPFKCFLDAYKGYHQIQMAKEDEEKTAFITSQGTFCYMKMPFSLRDAGATYQRLVDKVFHKQIGKNLEVYVDDLVIKSRTEGEIVRDIEETFKTLREINMKLNPKNVPLGGRRNVLRIQMEEAFKQMKQLIAELPMVTAPMEKEELIVYLAATKETVSAVLITEKEAKQMPIYFVSKALRGSELNYTLMEKLVLALVHASKHLKRIAEQMGVKNRQTNMDSRLVANHVNGTYVAKEADMIRYLEKVKALTGGFKSFTIKQIPRSENKKADALSKIASISFTHLSKQVLVEELKEKSTSKVEVLTVVKEEGDT
ncbi:reverse transcriptase domain-containing protein [Tanacetum coccineum]